MSLAQTIKKLEELLEMPTLNFIANFTLQNLIVLKLAGLLPDEYMIKFVP